MLEVIKYLSTTIAMISIAVIIYGFILTVLAFLKNELVKTPKSSVRQIRANFGGYLLLGLELLIAADIIKSVIDPTYQELIILGGIVLLRTILSFFLNKEIKELESNS